MATYYHVAPDTYNDGEPLYSWDAYHERYGENPTAWKWEDAEEGFDTDIVSLFTTMDDAREYQQDFGGVILTVTIDDDADVRVITNSEGYAAVVGRIPAEYITR